MESVLKCATLHENSASFVTLKKDGLTAWWQNVLRLGEVLEIIRVFWGDAFCLTVN